MDSVALGITAPVAGASRPDRLVDAIAAVDLDLGAVALVRLDAASALDPEFGDSAVMAGIGPMALGGHAVRGWTETR